MRLGTWSRGWRCAAVLGAILGTLAPWTEAAAQTDAADPGNLQRRLDQTRPPDARAGETPAPDAADTDPALRAPSGEVAPSVEDAGTFVLSAVLVEGATAFERARFAPAYEALLATRVTLADLTAIARRITEIYREAGYVLSRAVVPPQDVAGGVLRVRIVEGHVARTDLIGARGHHAALRPLLDGLSAERPVTQATLERTVLLLRDRPGLSVDRAALAPLEEEEGAYALRLELSEDAYDGTAYLDNRGERATGRLQSWLAGAANNRLGLGERIRIGVFAVPHDPQELTYLEGRWTQPLGGAGTVLEGTLAGSASDAGADLAAFQTESESRRAELELRHPLLRSHARSLWGRVAFEAVNLREDAFGQQVFEDRIRSVRLGAEYWRPRLWDGSLFASVTGSVGLDLFDATTRSGPNRSRLDADGRYEKIEAEIRRVQELPAGFSLLAKATGQLSDDPLLSAEEFGLGGSAYGRGYDFGEVTGEHALAGLAELRYGGDGADLGDGVGGWLASWQLYAFHDLGAVWNENASEPFERRSLASAGAGLRVSLEVGLWGQIEVAQPLTYTPDDPGDRDPRVFFALNWRF